MKKNYHLTVSIAGLEDRLTGKVSKKYGSWQVLENNGTFVTKSQVWAEIERCKKLGYEVIPTCENIDEKGRCKGHEVKE